MHFELNSEDLEKHVCQSSRQGDVLIFKCPDCGYIRHWDQKTHQIRLVNKGNENALHSGFYEPVGLQMNNMNPN